MSQAVLLQRETVGGGLVRVDLEVPQDLALTHEAHGQFVDLRHSGQEPGSEEVTLSAPTRGFFALVSDPGSAVWSILVKDGGSMAARLRRLPAGTNLDVSSAMGRGFPLERARERRLLLAASGTGLAAVLSAARARVAAGQASQTFLAYGVRERAEVALESFFQVLREAGMAVAMCISREAVTEDGFLQGSLSAVLPKLGWDLRAAMVFAAGQAELLEQLRRVGEGIGIASGDVFANT